MLQLDLHVLRRALPIVIHAEVEHHLFTCAGGIAEVRIAALDCIGFPAHFDLRLSSRTLLFALFRTLGHNLLPFSCHLFVKLSPSTAGGAGHATAMVSVRSGRAQLSRGCRKLYKVIALIQSPSTMHEIGAQNRPCARLHPLRLAVRMNPDIRAAASLQ